MKRIFMAFVLAMVLVLTACNDDTPKQTDPISTSEDEVVGDATLTGVTNVTVALNGTFNDMTDVSAKDHDDTDITSDVTVTGTVDTTKPGTYTLTYKVTGESGNEVTKDRTVEVVSEKPVITVEPVSITITEGDDLDLMLGVSATDDYDSEVTVTISNNGGFDKNTPATYTITYQATDSEGHTSSATREVIVEEIVVAYFVEVQNENDANWGSKILTVSGNDFIVVTADYDLGDPTNVTLVHNTSENAIVVTSSDVYGELAVIDKNGVVVEGRDGANGKLVNADNPLRASGAVLDPQKYAENVTVPAGGLLLIAPNNPDGVFDTDGRSFIAKNVIYKFENIVSIYLEDNSEIVTNYIDRAPTIENLGKIEVLQGATYTTEELEALVKAGVKITDDNATFDPSDDIVMTLEDVMVQADANFDTAKLGEYIFLLGAADTEGHVRTVQRIVEVVPAEPDGPTIEINNARFDINPSLINPSTLDKTGINIFTPDFDGDFANYVFNYSVVAVVDGDGNIVLVRNWTKEYSVENPEGIELSEAGYTAGNMLEGLTVPTEGYILVFPNDGGTNLARSYGSDNAKVDNTVTLYNVYLVPTLEANEKTYTFDLADVNPETINIKGVNVFTSNYTGDITALSVKWSVVVVLDANGNIILTRDGANGKQIDVDHPNAVSGLPAADAGWAVDNMMAGLTIPEGGLVLVFPNDGTNGANSPRTFGLSNMRTYGTTVTFHKFNYQPSITANGKTINAVVNPETPNTKTAMIFDSNYGQTIDFSLGYGVLVVVDETGKVVKVHDGANGKYWDADNTSGVAAGEHFTAGDYTNGVEIPANGFVLVFPNDGTNGADSPRTFGMGLRTYGLDVTVSLGL